MVNKELKVLDKGFVRLVTYDASDDGICDAARVSYQKGTKKVRENRDLIRYLLRHEHGTPFEMNFFKFHVKAPIFVFRQWHRHRVGISINEMSGRYSKLDDECYLPEPDRIKKQSTDNKQGSGEHFEEDWAPNHFITKMEEEQKNSFSNYGSYINEDLARELARINLPVSTYSQMYWACNLRSLFNFIRLRLHPHAQYEIRQYAEAMYELIKPIVPLSCEAFEDYILNASTFSKHEMKIIKLLISKNDFDTTGLSKREVAEFKTKLGI